MKVSVVTVCFNSSATIADTLRSINSQTHADVEHIVVDGASTDNTVALVREHGRRVSALVSERDKGIYDAMNKGLALATGSLVGFLNADDVYAHADVLANVAAVAAAGSQLPDAVYGDLVYVHSDDMSRIIRTWHSGEFSIERLRYGWMPPHPTFFARTDALRQLGGFDTDFRIAADYDCMLRYLNRPHIRVAYMQEVLVRMRMGGASNKSLKAMLSKSREDLRAARRNDVGGLITLFCKNTRKLPQFWRR